ncbi:MAG: hypothetical protein KC464_26980 [Myxococcales bacterium]|nr:hypothetical protein [Myxococcales bacterium]
MHWDRDEIILALALYLDIRDGHVTNQRAATRALATAIGRNAVATGNAVLAFNSVDPQAWRTGRSVTPAAQRVWDELAHKPDDVRKLARGIRSRLKLQNPTGDPRELSAEDVWLRVQAFAANARRTKRPIFTLQTKVKNFITDVKAGSIGRRSAAGRSNTSRVGRAAVATVWSELLNGGPVATPPGVLYFAPALMLDALPDAIEYVGNGEIALRQDARVRERNLRRQRSAGGTAGGGQRGGGGEGPVHAAIKQYIERNPDEALGALGPVPFTCKSTEFVFATGDRVDVLLIDGEGRIVLVEVKPLVDETELAPFAQAAKYRTLWHVLEGRDLSEIRCVVAAPRIPPRMGRKMRTAYNVEHVEISVAKADPALAKKLGL